MPAEESPFDNPANLISGVSNISTEESRLKLLTANAITSKINSAIAVIPQRPLSTDPELQSGDPATYPNGNPAAVVSEAAIRAFALGNGTATGSIEVTQAGHPFTGGTLSVYAAYHNGTGYQLADPSDENKLARFLITDVVGNDFNAIQYGRKEIDNAALAAAVTAGEYYYVNTGGKTLVASSDDAGLALLDFLTPIFQVVTIVGNVVNMDILPWRSEVNGELPEEEAVPAVVTSATNLLVGKVYRCDSSGGAFTVTLPATGLVDGDEIVMCDVGRAWATNNVTINANSAGRKINGDVAAFLADVDNSSMTLHYVTSLNDWFLREVSHG